MDRLRQPPSLVILIICIFHSSIVKSQVLTPPYINLASGRRITATSTCGEEVSEPELYCKLVGASHSDTSIDLIQGQVCK